MLQLKLHRIPRDCLLFALAQQLKLLEAFWWIALKCQHMRTKFNLFISGRGNVESKKISNAAINTFPIASNFQSIFGFIAH